MNMLNYTEDHKEFREKFRAFVDEEIIPNADQWEKDRITPKEIWQKMGQEGFLCPCIAKEYGGPGRDFLHSVIIMEEMARSNQSGLMCNLHSDIIVPYIDTFGTEEQKKKYLPGCISGDTITAVAMTEPDAGSDLAAMTTTAEEDGDAVVINGAKTFISNGINCDLVVLAAKDPAVENPHQAISLYLVEANTPGFKKGNRLEKMGMHGQDTAELFFTDCRIPKANLLGKKGAGFLMLMQKLQQERLVCSISAVAKAEYILGWTMEYCNNGADSGRPLAKSQTVQFALAEMATEIKILKTFTDKLTADHMAHKNVVAETSMAKFRTTEAVNDIANRCMDIIGEFGTDEACPVVREWRDMRVLTIFAGANEIMKGIIAKSLGL